MFTFSFSFYVLELFALTSSAPVSAQTWRHANQAVWVCDVITGARKKGRPRPALDSAVVDWIVWMSCPHNYELRSTCKNHFSRHCRYISAIIICTQLKTTQPETVDFLPKNDSCGSFVDTLLLYYKRGSEISAYISKHTKEVFWTSQQWCLSTRELQLSFLGRKISWQNKTSPLTPKICGTMLMCWRRFLCAGWTKFHLDFHEIRPVKRGTFVCIWCRKSWITCGPIFVRKNCFETVEIDISVAPNFHW